MFNQDVTRRSFGLLFCGVALPALYGFLMLFALLVGDMPSMTAGQVIASIILIMLPVAVGGVGQWWDVWVKPPPKFGSDWLRVPPEDYVRGMVKLQGILAVIGVVGTLLFGQFGKDGQVISVLLFLGGSAAFTALFVPHRLEHDSGKPIVDAAGAGVEADEPAEPSAKEPDGLGAVVREIFRTISGKESLTVTFHVEDEDPEPPKAIPLQGDARTTKAPVAKLVDDGIQAAPKPRKQPPGPKS